MDFGILRALDTVRANPYVNYVGLGLAGLVAQKDLHDPVTGAPLRKTKWQLVRISAAVCGIELCYAAETAFVSPILLKLGVPTTLMTMVWCLSPLLGFFLVPIMGSLSDRCRMRIGRRRPFIILMAIGIVLGLALVPNGETLGRMLGDSKNVTLLSHPKTHAVKAVKISSGEKELYSVPHKSVFDVYERGIRSRPINYKTKADTDYSQLNSSSSGEDARYNILATRYKDSKGFMNVIDNSSAPDDSSTPPPPLMMTFTLPYHGVRGIILTIVGVAMLDFNCDACQSPCRAYLLDVSVPEDHPSGLTTFTVMAGLGGMVGYFMGGIDWNKTSFGEALGGHIRVVFTIVLFCFILCIISTLTSFRETPLDELDIRGEADVRKVKKKKGKKKYRRFNNEETSSSDGESEDRNSAMQDCGQTLYGSLTDSKTGSMLQRDNSCTNGHAHTLNGDFNQKWTIVNGSNKPHLPEAQNGNQFHEQGAKRPSSGNPFLSLENGKAVPYSSECRDEINPYPTKLGARSEDARVPLEVDDIKMVDVSTDVTLRTYLRSIVHMPSSLWVLCLSNLLCWMSLVCYSLYFTDFVGQSVYGGDPSAPIGSDLHNRYDAGVRLGSWGMSLYSFSCSCYSFIIERLVKRFRARPVYVYGQLTYCIGMIGMAIARTPWAVLVFSPTAGVMYATLFTMPYMLVAHYHTRGLFSPSVLNDPASQQVRGLGTDVAIVSSMVFLAQFLLSVAMGTIMAATGSTVTVLVASSILSFCGSLTAMKVTYLDL